jgi:hypothetical protein
MRLDLVALASTCLLVALGCGGKGAGPSPCTSGGTCTSSNPCRTAAIACVAGQPVCTENGNVAENLACGAGRACRAGTCLALVPAGGAQLLGTGGGRMTAGTIIMDAQVGVPLGPTEATGGTITMQDATISR